VNRRRTGIIATGTLRYRGAAKSIRVRRPRVGWHGVRLRGEWWAAKGGHRRPLPCSRGLATRLALRRFSSTEKKGRPFLLVPNRLASGVTRPFGPVGSKRGNRHVVWTLLDFPSSRSWNFARKMKGLSLIVGCLLGVLACPPPALALPVLTWLSPWGADPESTTTFIGGRAAAAFGLNATDDGQITDTAAAGDTGASTAVVRAVSTAALALLNPLGVGDANATVFFWRSFVLPADSPFWRVTLEGDLLGLLNSLSTDATSSVAASASIVAGVFNNFSLIGRPALLNVTPAGLIINTDDKQNLISVESKKMILPSGSYTVQGSLSAAANVQGTFGVDGAASDFGGLNTTFLDFLLPNTIRDRSFEVFVDAQPVPAQPVPEPSVFVMVGLGLWVLAVTRYGWRRQT